MLDNVYDYLREYGFSKELLEKVEDKNEYIFYISLGKVKENINYFENLGFNKEEFIKLVKDNYFNLTLSTTRKNKFNEIYLDKLNLSNEEIKHLLINNNEIYTFSFLNLENIVNYFNIEKKYSFEYIKKLFLSDPMILCKSLEEIKKTD